MMLLILPEGLRPRAPELRVRVLPPRSRVVLAVVPKILRELRERLPVRLLVITPLMRTLLVPL